MLDKMLAESAFKRYFDSGKEVGILKQFVKQHNFVRDISFIVFHSKMASLWIRREREIENW